MLKIARELGVPDICSVDSIVYCEENILPLFVATIFISNNGLPKLSNDEV